MRADAGENSNEHGIGPMVEQGPERGGLPPASGDEAVEQIARNDEHETRHRGRCVAVVHGAGNERGQHDTHGADSVREIQRGSTGGGVGGHSGKCTDSVPGVASSRHLRRRMSRILVTGANGHLGRRLLPVLATHADVVALVRSERARDTLLRHSGKLERVTVALADPSRAADINRVAAGCEHAVHLIGTIKATAKNSLRAAHEIPAVALVKAMDTVPIRHVVYLSILGAGDTSASECLRARAAVERIFSEAPAAATMIRVPMVLGERDRASFALAKRAAAKRPIVFRASSLEQPIYAGDVVAALGHTLTQTPAHNRTFDLAGPRSLSRRDLILAAGRLVGRRPSVVSLPILCGMALARVFEATRTNPPLTRDMLRILDHDDAIDPLPAAAALGITLTPLEEMLERCIVGRLPQALTV